MIKTNTTIAIESLEGMHFVVENYQRGYKWTAQQVLDLLEDVSFFDTKEDSFYCLQPLALVALDEESKTYEVIDGQQRLTTTFIILSLLDGSFYSIRGRPFYSITYNTREGSKAFLNNIATLLKNCDVTDIVPSAETMVLFEKSVGEKWNGFVASNKTNDNTDTYHFFTAAQTILAWKSHFPEKSKKLISNLKQHTRFIWYIEPREKDPKVVFRNLNSGKIPLTNAELLKADFINERKNSNVEILALLQNELATEWDLIEQSLHDNQFWYFINNDTDSEKYETRIDFLFELLLGDQPKNNEDERYIHRQFQQKMIQGELHWDDVRICFYQLREWFEDNELYHLIGYIVDRKVKTIKTIFNESRECGKREFRDKLIDYIKQDFKRFVGDSGEEFLALLGYGRGDKTDRYLHKALLLYNLEIYQNSNAHYRFPFDKFKSQKWTLEHIHAQKTGAFTVVSELLDWIADIKLLKEAFPETAEGSEEAFPIDAFEDLQSVVGLYSPEDEISDEMRDAIVKVDEPLVDYFDMHSISNMALLDGSTNSSFSNHPFKVKRQKLIDIDKRQWSDDGKDGKAFIPIGTKNVFLKHTSDSIEQLSVWGAKDRQDYLKHITNTLKPYLPKYEVTDGE